MKVLVTGGAGFIGSHLVDRLLKDGHQVRIIDNLSTGKKENLNPGAEFIKADISRLEEIEDFFKGVEIVFHLAALPRIQPSIKDPASTNQANIIGTFNVLMASKNKGVRKVVYSASSSAYGNQDQLPLREEMKPNPQNPYSLSKYVGEEYCRLFTKLYNLDTISLRYFNVYGFRMDNQGDYATVIALFLKQKAQRKPLTIVGDGSQTRDFTYVDDVVEANIKAAKIEGKGKVINIGTGKNYSINQLAQIIGGQTINLDPRPGEAKDTLADISLAKKILNWQPRVSLEEGVRKLLK